MNEVTWIGRVSAGAWFLAVCVLSFSVAAFSQELVLEPSIGVETLPDDTDSVCEIPEYITPDVNESGYNKGELVPDFTLYTLEGQAVNLKTELEKGKPVFLVAGSFTCPVYRERMERINYIAEEYRDDITSFAVYVLEPHPIEDISPYFGIVATGRKNELDSILYRQPRTYGERKAVASDMLERLEHRLPVIIDGPCNEWWWHFGPAPNNAYLIDTNGRVHVKQWWFDVLGEDMEYEVLDLLGRLPTDVTSEAGVAGTRVSLYPNPFHHTATVQTKGLKVPFTFTVYDVLGNRVAEYRNIYGEQFTLDGRAYAAGSYFFYLHRAGVLLGSGTFVKQ